MMLLMLLLILCIYFLSFVSNSFNIWSAMIDVAQIRLRLYNLNTCLIIQSKLWMKKINLKQTPAS